MTGEGRYSGWLALTLLLIAGGVSVASMRSLSVTYDEPRHFLYGEHILAGNSDRFDDSKMPLSALNAIPGTIATRLFRATTSDTERLRAGRYVTVLLSLVVAWVLFEWSRELYGFAAGLLTLFLYLIDPSLLAHSQLVTTDTYAAAGVTLAAYSFWRYLRRPTWSRLIGAGLILGVAQLAKYTALALFPLFAGIAVLFHATGIHHELQTQGTSALKRRALAAIGPALLLGSLALLVVNAGFLFNGTGTRLRDYTFRSSAFRSVQHALAPVGAMPLPVPHPFLEGLDWVVQRERSGEGYGGIYLLGELRHGVGFAGYYFVATLFKVPIGSQCLLAATLIMLVRRVGRGDDLRHEWVLMVPLLFFTVYFNFFFRAQIGIRYFLVVFPLAYVLAGGLLRNGVRVSRTGYAGVAVAVLASLMSVASYYPHFLPYFNELIGDRRRAYTVLADSNIDWGQHQIYLRDYRRTHPDSIVEPARPTAGRILVGVNALTGVAGDPETFRWLREHFHPVDDVAHAVLVYRVYPTDLDRLRLESGSANQNHQ